MERFNWIFKKAKLVMGFGTGKEPASRGQIQEPNIVVINRKDLTSKYLARKNRGIAWKG